MRKWGEGAFIEWLRAQGAEVLAPTNQWEAARFRARDGVHVLYRRKGGGYTAGDFVQLCMGVFESGGNLSMGFTGKRTTLAGRTKAALLARDGDLCFFCARVMMESEITVEHLMGVGKGGPNHMDNFALAHEACNKKAGNLPLMEKMVIAAVSRGAEWNLVRKGMP